MTAPTRERLLAAAIAIVAREGLEAASVKAIAAEAGLAPGLLHYHFASKEALLESALRQALESYLERVRAERARTPPDRLLAALVDSGRAAVIEDADVFRLRLAFAAKALADEKLAAVVRDLNAAAIEETAITLAMARGARAPAKRDRALAATLKAAFDGIMLHALLDPAFPQTTAADFFRAGAESLVRT